MTRYETEFDQAARGRFTELLEKVRADLAHRHGLASELAIEPGTAGRACAITLRLTHSVRDWFRIEYTDQLGGRFIGVVAGLHVVPALSTHAVPGIDSVRVALGAWRKSIALAVARGKVRQVRFPSDRPAARRAVESAETA
jgi:hypothetical protein